MLKVRYKNKKFTFETQKDNKLLVFGILINYDTNLKFLFFSKKTDTGLVLNFVSFVPEMYKLGSK